MKEKTHEHTRQNQVAVASAHEGEALLMGPGYLPPQRLKPAAEDDAFAHSLAIAYDVSTGAENHALGTIKKSRPIKPFPFEILPIAPKHQSLAPPVVTDQEIQRQTNSLTSAPRNRLFTKESNQGLTYSKTGWVHKPVFDAERMVEELPKQEIIGAGDPRLAAAMLALYKDPEGAELERALKTISKIRGGTVAELKVQYERSREIRQASDDYARWTFEANPANEGKSYKTISPDLDVKKHPEFTGSLTQLRYGSIMGEVFGLDPVFGSMLNPTGGIVGAGNENILSSTSEANNPLVLHGTVHDAAGYLMNGHGIRPGYNYLQKDWELSSTNPLSGQVSGLDHWISNGSGIGSGLYNILTAPFKGISKISSGLIGGIKNLAKGVGSGLQSIGSGLLNGGKESLSGLGTGISDIMQGNVRSGLSNMGSGLWKGLQEATGGMVDGVLDVGAGIGNAAKSIFNGGVEGIGTMISEPVKGLNKIRKGIWNWMKKTGRGIKERLVPSGKKTAASDIPDSHLVDEVAAHHVSYLKYQSDIVGPAAEVLENAGYDPGMAEWVKGDLGFQAVLIPSMEEGGAAIMSIRGTASTQGVNTDLDIKQVGHTQYYSNQEKLLELMERVDGKVNVSGHSLGGAVAQLLVANYPDKVKGLTTFQSPGISSEEADKYKEKIAGLPEGEVPKINHHIANNDLVDLAGEKNLPGTVYKHHLKDGINPVKAHTASIFGTDQFRGKREAVGGGSDYLKDIFGKEEYKEDTGIKAYDSYPHPMMRIGAESIRKTIGTGTLIERYLHKGYNKLTGKDHEF